MADSAQVPILLNRARDGDDAAAEQQPRQRRNICDNCSDDPDIILLCNDNVEFFAHKTRMSASCELFDDMFLVAHPDVPGQSDRPDTHADLPIVPLMESSSIAALVLPLLYRRPPSALRDKPFPTLSACITFAHRMGMVFAVDCFAIFLESHVKLHALDIYEIACRLDLVHLKDACLPEVVKQYNPSDPYALAAQVGMSNARPIHAAKIETVRKIRDMVSKLQDDASAASGTNPWELNCRCNSSYANQGMGQHLASIYSGLCQVACDAPGDYTLSTHIDNAVLFSSSVVDICEHWNIVRKGFKDIQTYWETVKP